MYGSQGHGGADKNQREQASGCPTECPTAPIAPPASSPVPPVGHLCREAGCSAHAMQALEQAFVNH